MRGIKVASSDEFYHPQMKTFCRGEILLRDIFEFSLVEIKHMCSTERPHISLILPRRLQQVTSPRERNHQILTEASPQQEIF